MLVLTGPSHAGKTTVAEEVLTIARRPAAYLSVDDALERTLQRPAGDIWAEIPLAYELICSDLKVLLERGWLVIVESTFTYISPEGDGELHRDALAEMLEIAASRQLPWWVVQLTAERETLLARADRTSRLDSTVVSGTFALHQDGAALLAATQVVDTDSLDPRDAATAILAHLAEPAA
ncbi:MAG TPA: AAA family ATPase [Solirubrobacterales bacterium]|nr:AAA family ATPase [Solirubrobacterales bacterium]